MNPPQDKKLKKKFEKVVEGDEDLRLCIIALISMISSALVTYSTIKEIMPLYYISAVLTFFGVFIWILGIIVSIGEREVYWREKK